MLYYGHNKKRYGDTGRPKFPRVISFPKFIVSPLA